MQEDTIFVSGMPPTATEDEIKDHFGSIGIIKMDKRTQRPKIWMYKDKATGRMKGECTVTFDDPFTAKSAIQWFDGKLFMGRTVKVQMAERPKSSYERGRGGFGGESGDRGGSGGRGRGGGGGGGGDRGFERRGGPPGRGGGGGDRDSRDGPPSGGRGDWRCPVPSCGNNNFAWRNSCNRCNEPKPAGLGGDDDGGSGGGGGGFRGGFRGRGDRGGFRGRGGDRGGRGGFRGRGGYGDRDGDRDSGGPMKGDRGPGRSRPY
ncbi:hypothetical protein OTU49_000508 [Cherax quadricarinatus]|uniref:RNA-binding protein cabeza n=3 Tax=Cherax quadricarinatus TaxID=27406 RepID=A0AAW0Y0G8_CHEQU